MIVNINNYTPKNYDDKYEHLWNQLKFALSSFDPKEDMLLGDLLKAMEIMEKETED